MNLPATKERRYNRIDLDKLEQTIKANPNLSQRQLAKMFDVAQPSICIAISKLQIEIEKDNTWKDNKSKHLEHGQRVIYDELLSTDRIKNARFSELTLAWNSFFNAQRLEEGKSTENISQINHLIVEAREHRKALEGGAIAKLAGGPGGKGKE